MHQLSCNCPKCQQRGAAFEVLPFGRPPALPFTEAEEEQLAMELLSVSNEAELEQFLGGMFKGIWKGIKKVAAPLGGALKAVARQALPFVGGALGSMIPIPGVGTALGTALGGAVSKALELEFSGLEGEQQEYEMARRFVRMAGQAAQLAGQGDGSPAAVRAALVTAARQQLPYLAAQGDGSGQQGGQPGGPQGELGLAPWRGPMTGRWRRRGQRIVVLGNW